MRVRVTHFTHSVYCRTDHVGIVDYILYNPFYLEFPDLKLFSDMTIFRVRQRYFTRKPVFAICEQQTLRCLSICKSARSDQHHLCSLLGYNNT